MSTTTSSTTSPTPPPASAAPPGRDRTTRGWLPQLLLRLHFYAGLLVGPFVLVAALTGAVYALTPSIERVVYAEQLSTDGTGVHRPLSEQVATAQAYTGGERVAAVRPAPDAGSTTRVMFAAPGLGESESRAIFVDPYTNAVRGDLTVYGTSGALPVRTWVDQLHRGLHLGEPGRLYSELAASWLWVVALAGLGLWLRRLRRTRRLREMLLPPRGRAGYRRTRDRHAAVGAWVLVGALGLSATGITWSQLAGERVTDLRAQLGWSAPALDTELSGGTAAAGAHHAGHHGDGGSGEAPRVAPVSFDTVLGAARQAGIDAGQVEVSAPAAEGSAWVVREIRAAYPTEVDTVAVDGDTLEVTDRVTFAEHPFVAKLARWGIDLHIGALFGLANQVALFVLACGIAASVVWGYAMWWRRGTTRPGRVGGRAPARGALARAPWWGLAGVAAVALVVGLALPLVGISLLVFVLVDAGRGLLARRREVGAAAG